MMFPSISICFDLTPLNLLRPSTSPLQNANENASSTTENLGEDSLSYVVSESGLSNVSFRRIPVLLFRLSFFRHWPRKFGLEKGHSIQHLREVDWTGTCGSKRLSDKLKPPRLEVINSRLPRGRTIVPFRKSAERRLVKENLWNQWELDWHLEMLAFSAFFHPSDAGFPVSMVCAANLVLLISCVTFSTAAPAPEAKPDPDFNPFRFGEFPRRKGRLLVNIHAAVSFYL